jgi:hypothetical protein
MASVFLWNRDISFQENKRLFREFVQQQYAAKKRLCSCSECEKKEALEKRAKRGNAYVVGSTITRHAKLLGCKGSYWSVSDVLSICEQHWLNDIAPHADVATQLGSDPVPVNDAPVPQTTQQRTGGATQHIQGASLSTGHPVSGVCNIIPDLERIRV